MSYYDDLRDICRIIGGRMKSDSVCTTRQLEISLSDNGEFLTIETGTPQAYLSVYGKIVDHRSSRDDHEFMLDQAEVEIEG